MTWVAVGVGVGTAVVGYVASDQASSRAADAQQAAAQTASNTELNMFYQNREDQRPWRQAGVQALGQLQDNSFMNNWQSEDPGYQFRMQQGMDAINSSAAARGMANSGRTMKELTRYGQDYASNEYNNAYNRNYGRLSSLAGIGQTSTNLTGQQGMAVANSIGQNQIGAANAYGASQMAQANNLNSSLGGIANTYAQYQMINRLYPKGGGGSVGGGTGGGVG